MTNKKKKNNIQQSGFVALISLITSLISLSVLLHVLVMDMVILPYQAECLLGVQVKSHMTVIARYLMVWKTCLSEEEW